MKSLLFQLLTLSFFISSNIGPEEQLIHLMKSMNNEDVKPLIETLKNGLKDTLNNWCYIKNYENIQGLAEDEWKIDDAVFLSPQKDKVILLVLSKDKAKFTTNPTGVNGEEEERKPTSYDFVQLIYANKEKDGWHYYYKSMEFYIVSREKKENNTPIPLSFDELSIFGRKSVLSSYYKIGTCKYDKSFFDSWDIENLKEQHKDINGYKY
jgi:hypothetical protein